MRGATPVTSRRTRSEGVQCLRIGCTASHNKHNRGHSLSTHYNRQYQTKPHGLEILAQIPRKTRYTRSVTVHPLRCDAPVTSRCTRSEEVQCLQIGCTASHNKHNRGQFAPTDPNRPPQTLRHSFNMLTRLRTRGATPVTSQCTRYVAMHPLRRNAPVTQRCTRSEEVQCLQIGCTASHNKHNRGQFAPTDPNRPPRTQQHSFNMLARLRTRGAAPVTLQCTRYVAMHPLRRATPVTSQCTRSEGVQCLQIGCTASHNKHNRENVPSRKKPRRLPLGNRRGLALTIQLSRSW